MAELVYATEMGGRVGGARVRVVLSWGVASAAGLVLAAACTHEQFAMDEPSFGGFGSGGSGAAPPSSAGSSSRSGGGAAGHAGASGAAGDTAAGGDAGGGFGSAGAGSEAGQSGDGGDGGGGGEGGDGGEAGTSACHPGRDSCVEPCEPGALRCVAGARAAREACADGVWVTAPACAGTCAGDGQCVGDCAPGSKKCQGDTPLTCSEGASWVLGKACPFVCAGAGECDGTCKPATTRCVSDGPKGSVQTCSSEGQWLPEQACPKRCSQGACERRADVVLSPVDSNETSGTAAFEQVGSSVTLTLSLKGCPLGSHEVELSALASCQAADPAQGQSLGQISCAADGKGSFSMTAAPGVWSIGAGGEDDVLQHALVVRASAGAEPLAGVVCGVPVARD